jgi:enoyl-CoA hydratase/carnithine racemase
MFKIMSIVSPLTRSDADAVAHLRLSNSAQRNPLSEELLAELKNQLTAIAQDTSIRAVILSADGPVFCAGHDLKQMMAHRQDPDRGRAYFTTILKRCSALMQQIVALPQPVIAAVEGVATAAGCQLAATCDLVVAGADAKFCTPGVHIGLFCSTPMVALSRSVSNKHAMEMLLLGEMADAETAYRFGLVNRVVIAGQAMKAAQDYASIISSKSALTIKTGKKAFYNQREMKLVDAYDYATEVMIENMLARDAAEGISAFIEKREPQWAKPDHSDE